MVLYSAYQIDRCSQQKQTRNDTNVRTHTSLWETFQNAFPVGFYAKANMIVESKQ